ncbi:MAG: AlbA family DNA-binding domain-containing protein [Solirubrobacterales bacterium]
MPEEGPAEADRLSSPVVVDGRVSDEKLSELLRFQAEYRDLDYKSACDPSTTRDLVELAKDVGAMQVFGGYILIGVDGDGALSGGLDQTEPRLFDEASLTSQLQKYLPVPHLACRLVERDGHKIAIIWVGANPSGCAFSHARGAYGDGASQTTVFNDGDVSLA